MAFDPSKITNGFIFLWKIENVYAISDRMESPTFIASNLEKTQWFMSMNKERTFLYLNRNYVQREEEIIEVDVAISVISSKGSINLLKKENGFEFGKSIIFCCSIYPHIEDNSIIHCYLQKSEEPSVSLVRCYAITHLHSERRNGIWSVKNFMYLMTMEPKTFTLDSTGNILPKIVLSGQLSKRSRLFHIDISIPKFPRDKKVAIIGKISVVATNGSLKFSQTKNFTIVNSSSSQSDSKFSISQDAIFEKSSEFLTNGNLLLKCDFSISNCEVYHEIRESCYLPYYQPFDKDFNFSCNRIEERNVPEISQEIHDFKLHEECQEQNEILEGDVICEHLNRKYCDVILRAENKSFPVHKCILCLKSPVFSKMFETDMIETANKKVDIDDLDNDTLHRFLLFLYTERLENLHWEIATKLFYAADKYQIISLKVQCSTFLKSHLSVSNVCEALQLADLHQEEDLKLQCCDFIFQQEAAKMFSSEEWKTFTLNNSVLSSEILQNYFLRKN